MKTLHEVTHKCKEDGCGAPVVEFRRQVITHDRPWKNLLETEPGVGRHICENGHYHDESFNRVGDWMPEDLTIRHFPPIGV